MIVEQDTTASPTRHTRLVDGIEVNTLSTEIADACLLEVEAGTTGKCGGDSGHRGRTYIRLKDLSSCDIRVSVDHPEDGPNGKTITITFGGDAELSCLKIALSSALSFIEQIEKETEAERRLVRLTNILESTFDDFRWDSNDRETVRRFASNPSFHPEHFAEWLESWDGWRSLYKGGMHLLLEYYDDFHPLEWKKEDRF
jgi:hypothetical protein